MDLTIWPSLGGGSSEKGRQKARRGTGCGRGGREGEYGVSTDLVAVEGLVVRALLVSQLHPNHHLLLLWKVLHIFFHSPKKNGPQLLLHSTQQLSVATQPYCTVIVILHESYRTEAGISSSQCGSAVVT